MTKSYQIFATKHKIVATDDVPTEVSGLYQTAYNAINACYVIQPIQYTVFEFNEGELTPTDNVYDTYVEAEDYVASKTPQTPELLTPEQGAE